MAYSARILLDSISPANDRLTTFELTYPRFVHSELLTHRVFSRNSSSSRAIPIERMIQRVIDDPVMPVYWGKNKPGMQAAEEITGDTLDNVKTDWLIARNEAVRSAKCMVQSGVHKQIVNRLLEPWMWITVILSSTSFGNFFNLRCHPDAQPEIRKIAEMMRDLYYSRDPKPLAYGQWHMPLTDDRDDLLDHLDYSMDDVKKISVGRCARVSYLTHDGKRDPAEDIKLHDRLITSGHWSPFEHVARPMDPKLGEYSESEDSSISGNFSGWVQYRKQFSNENREAYTQS